jgi:putative addiction module component (TIGR02574 family)
MDAKRVIDEALRLPVEIRAALAGELLASLDEVEVEADRESAWSAELQNRIGAYERGEVAAISGDEALAQIRA